MNLLDTDALQFCHSSCNLEHMTRLGKLNPTKAQNVAVIIIYNVVNYTWLGDPPSSSIWATQQEKHKAQSMGSLSPAGDGAEESSSPLRANRLP